MSVRISATDWVDGGFNGDDAVALAALLLRAGCDIVDVSTGQTSPDAAARPTGACFQTPFADRIRNEVGDPDHRRRRHLRATTTSTRSSLAGRADLCALARPHLHDPYWTLHAAADQGYDVEWVPQYRSGRGRRTTGKDDGIREAPMRRFDARRPTTRARRGGGPRAPA